MNVIGGNAERARKRFAHFREVRPELWFFRDDDRVDVFNREMLFVKQSSRVFEEKQAVRAFPLWIGIRKMRSNIAESSGAEQRIAHGMRQHIAIRVSDRSFVKGQLDPTNNQFSPFREAMEVISNAAAHAHGFWRSCSR
jgi:hypothetical protein